MAPVKEANQGLGGDESSNNLEDPSNRYHDIFELAQIEILNEIKDAIDQILFNKKMALMVYAKNQAAKVIEAERLANSYGWREALSEDVTADEFKRYLGITNIEAYFAATPEKVEKTETANQQRTKSKPRPPKNTHPSLPTPEELLKGAAKSSLTSAPEAPSIQSKPDREAESFQQNSKNEGSESFDETLNNHKPPLPESSFKKEQEETLTPQAALEIEQKESAALISLLRKCYAGFGYIESQNKKDEGLDKKVAAIRVAFLQFLKPFTDGEYSKDLYDKLSGAFSCLELARKDLIFISLHLTAQLVVKLAGFSLKDQPTRSRLAKALSLPIFAEYRDFALILYAHLLEGCPAILPLKNKVLSSSGDSVKVFAFYCILLITENSSGIKNFFNLSAAWHWIVSLCNAPIDENFCVYLDVMLEICGRSLIETYNDQAVKLLRHLMMRTANLTHLAAQQNRIRILNLIAKSLMPMDRES